MGIIKSYPITKIVNGLTINTTDSIVCKSLSYTTKGESAIIVRGVPKCVITLDETTTDHITIKSMTNVTIKSTKLIDDEYNEIETETGASVELRYVVDGWYIMSSDGLKNS
tara:strand:+ start:13115 stop:13447 length:333 start_codon:yes stop_codon:yes gene_type:complete